MLQQDKNKIDKAGYATPRGGSKGAYQNHVYRNNRVIIPYERSSEVPINEFADGYIIRLYPDQAFEALGLIKTDLVIGTTPIVVGDNAFVLYRSWDAWTNLPPLPNWEVRSLWSAGVEEGQRITATRRGMGVNDSGHYVLRLPNQGSEQPKKEEGPPQGIFAPEYATAETNYLSQCVLAWLIVHTLGSPYVTTQAAHLQAILEADGLLPPTWMEREGVVAHGLAKCPLCMRFLRYKEYHETISFSEEAGLGNAAEQVQGATRSTAANLFHISPLGYRELRHVPKNVAWGHAICNTRLGQRKCFSIPELVEADLKVGILHQDRTETFGFMSPDWEMIRSPMGAVWSQLHGDVAETDPPPSTDSDTQPTLEALHVPLVEDGNSGDTDHLTTSPTRQKSNASSSSDSRSPNLFGWDD